MRTIPLTQGKVALVDDEDFERLSKYKWCAAYIRKCWYAVRIKNKKTIRMHRFIMNAEQGQEIDHKNGNGLDNHRCNLRICTHAENIHNQKTQHRNKSSQYKGVSWYYGKWITQIKFNRKGIYLGSFINEIEAARTYDQKAKELFGEFAHTNF